MRMVRPLIRFALPLSLALLVLPSMARADDLFSTALHRYGLSVALASAFVVGLMTAATPCVYPMIAITVSVFGALLIAEHAVVARRGLAGIPMAFFTLNGAVSCLLGLVGTVDLWRGATTLNV